MSYVGGEQLEGLAQEADPGGPVGQPACGWCCQPRPHQTKMV